MKTYWNHSTLLNDISVCISLASSVFNYIRFLRTMFCARFEYVFDHLEKLPDV